MANFEELSKYVIGGNVAKVKQVTQALIDEGVSPLDIINQGLIAGMSVVGSRFKNGEMYVPEVLVAARSMTAGIDLVKPLIADQNMPSAGKVLLGTVKGDLHDIGKNLVGMMLESRGYTVVNAGMDISPEKFVEEIRKHNPDVLGMCALLTTTMLHMKDTIELLKEEGLRDQIQVIVGGAPLSQDFADEAGADGYAPDAASAVDLCNRLLA
ncbi:cobalamin B12-binding domain-containing protein [Sporomusa sphaeroides]|uniref:Methionine synthase n=2 Tax=Sporomusa TaxID=2375 RepID=A0ABM9VZ07_9FIRM|nr:corrinoid protein [Sporomusa sphaeroides]OLS57356.1 methionine synthase [Sporomusa sphaeroides DSM 2875]CVK18085.1 Methionine synthase [Sporomusa sphaeroides DSM 2875]SCM81314.1 Dimethylamine corrinoid protein 1 [uncultured Sporomusa sp.]